MENMKFVDEGHIITSAGISAGINMSFHIVKNLLGVEIAEETAKNMEYDIIDLLKSPNWAFSYFECI